MSLPLILAYLGLTLSILWTGTFAVLLIKDWAARRRDNPDTGDDTRQIDILKKGEVCPWNRAD